ncbi:BspA family leucine-rich repeat surface protein [Bifidobacterium sp. ESL0790]|uniref:BspA family leucine-rich repeat surface protein n=1 Tax=Bifidobacterium sp. ESL0790 TaxID=2983233 RepID=UPI0023F65EFF|nr:BspA family leucine-rich repeat surface protein [Bifidobacterium sp. ESL0790]WEV72503.1 BspA family leucine-rich repeat surface protein [Bifidobacterium sp. ESL0790]
MTSRTKRITEILVAAGVACGMLAPLVSASAMNPGSRPTSAKAGSSVSQQAPKSPSAPKPADDTNLKSNDPGPSAGADTQPTSPSDGPTTPQEPQQPQSPSQNTVGPQDGSCTPYDNPLSGSNDRLAWNVTADCTLHVTDYGTSTWISNNWNGYVDKDKITTISFEAYMPHRSFTQYVTASSMFANMASLTTINGLNKLDFKNTSSMEQMFMNDPNLLSVDLTGIDTSNVTNMWKMFMGPATTTVANGPKKPYALQHITFGPDFNTSKVTNMEAMFANCDNLEDLDVSMFDTSHVTNMHMMFDTDNVDDGIDNAANHDFPSQSHLGSIKFGPKFDTSHVTNMGFMFYGDNALTSLDVSHFNTGNVTDMEAMFDNVAKAPAIDVSGFDTSKVTNMSYMFWHNETVTRLDVGGFDMHAVTDTQSMFDDCWSVTTLAVSEFNTSADTNMQYMFSDDSSLVTLNVSGFDTSQATSMGGMFSDCTNLQVLDVSHFDTSKVRNMRFMFSDDYNITQLNVSGFDTKNVISMNSMFNYLSKVPEIDVSHFDTSKVGTVADDPATCPAVWNNTNNNYDHPCKTMEYMFNEDEALKHVNVGGFDTSSVKSTKQMFNATEHLETLNMSGFDLSNVTDVSFMFSSVGGNSFSNTLKAVVLGPNTHFRNGAYDNAAFNNLGYVPDWYQVDPVGTWHGTWWDMVGQKDASGNVVGANSPFGSQGTNPATRTEPTVYVHDGYVAFKFLPNNPANSDPASMDGVTGAMDVYAGLPSEASNPRSFNLPQNHYSITGHRFIEWNTEANGTGRGYTVDDQYTIPEDTPGHPVKNTTIKFYAKWFKSPDTPEVTAVAQHGNAIAGVIPSDNRATVDITVEFEVPDGTKTNSSLKIFAKSGRNSFLNEDDVNRFPVYTIAGNDLIATGSPEARISKTFTVNAADIPFLKSSYPDFNYTFTAIETLSGVEGEQSGWEPYSTHLDFAPPVIKPSATMYRVTGQSSDTMDGTLANVGTDIASPTTGTAAGQWDTDISGEPPVIPLPRHEKAGNQLTFTWPGGAAPTTTSSNVLNGTWSTPLADIVNLTDNVTINAVDSLGNEAAPVTPQLIYTPVIDSVTSPTTVNGELPAGSVVKVKISHIRPASMDWGSVQITAKPEHNSIPDTADLTDLGTGTVTYSRDLCTGVDATTGCTAAESGTESTITVNVPVNATYPFTTYPDKDWTFEVRIGLPQGGSPTAYTGVAKANRHMDMEPPSIENTKNSYLTSEANLGGKLWTSTRTAPETPTWTLGGTAPSNPDRAPEMGASLTVTWPDNTTSTGSSITWNDNKWSVAVPANMQAGTVKIQATDSTGNESYTSTVRLTPSMVNALPFTGFDNLWVRGGLAAAVIVTALSLAYVSGEALKRTHGVKAGRR